MDIPGRAKQIKLLLLDVDGVLTDGRIVIGNYGDEIKNAGFIHEMVGDAEPEGRDEAIACAELMFEV